MTNAIKTKSKVGSRTAGENSWIQTDLNMQRGWRVAQNLKKKKTKKNEHYKNHRLRTVSSKAAGCGRCGLTRRPGFKSMLLASIFGCGGHLGFPIGTVLNIFDLQITPILPTKFRVSWPFGSGEKVQNRISRKQSWISDWNEFRNFWFAIHPDTSYHVSGQLDFRFRRRGSE